MKFNVLLGFCLFFAVGCASSGSLSEKEREIYEKQITLYETQQERYDEAAGAVLAAKTSLAQNNETKTHAFLDYAFLSLSPTNPIILQKWREIQQNPQLIGQETKLLLERFKQEQNALNSIQKEKQQLYEETTKKLSSAEEEIGRLLSGQDLKKRLIHIFGYAAVAALVGGFALFYFNKAWGFNMLAAAGCLGLAAYLITTSWFGYLAAAFAIIFLCGILYMIFGAKTPNKTLKTIVSTLQNKPNALEEIKPHLKEKMTQAEKQLVKNIKKFNEAN